MKLPFTSTRRAHPAKAFAKEHGLTLFAAASAGAALLYLLERRRGGELRGGLAGRAASVSNAAAERIGKRARDLRNRTRGAIAGTRNRFTSDDPDDQTLVARVRAQLGHHVANAASIETDANDGVVTLRGPVLASELGDVLSGVRAVRGVHDVRNELDVFENANEMR